MKRTVIHVLFLMTLASSFPAFAASDKSKDKDKTETASNGKAACPSASRYDEDNYKGNARADNGAEKSRQQLIKEQEKQWLRDVDYAR